MAKKAKIASYELAKLSTELKNRALISMADALEENSEQILEANRKDVQDLRQIPLKKINDFYCRFRRNN